MERFYLLVLGMLVVMGVLLYLVATWRGVARVQEARATDAWRERERLLDLLREEREERSRLVTIISEMQMAGMTHVPRMDAEEDRSWSTADAERERMERRRRP